MGFHGGILSPRDGGLNETGGEHMKPSLYASTSDTIWGTSKTSSACFRQQHATTLPKSDSVCPYKNQELEERNPPEKCLWNTSCGTSHPAAPEKSLGAHQPDSAESSALDHSACKTLCRYSAMTPVVSWTPLWQFVHPAPLGEDPGPPPVSEGFPWRMWNE